MLVYCLFTLIFPWLEILPRGQILATVNTQKCWITREAGQDAKKDAVEMAFVYSMLRMVSILCSYL